MKDVSDKKKMSPRLFRLTSFLAGLIMFIGAALLVFSFAGDPKARGATTSAVMRGGGTFISGFALLIAVNLSYRSSGVVQKKPA